MIKIIKKDGNLELFDKNKIITAIQKAGDRVGYTFSNKDNEKIIQLVLFQIGTRKEIPVLEMHEIVLKALYEINKNVYVEYRGYRNYKERFNHNFNELIKTSKTIIFKGDKENANKNSALDSTKYQLIAEESCRQMMKSYELNPLWVKAHDEGFIHLHDCGSRYLFQQNCCLFDMENLLKGGFELNGVKYKEPKYIETAIGVMSDAILSASSCQYGGFTTCRVDEFLATYVQNSYEKERDFYKSRGLRDEEIDRFLDDLIYSKLKRSWEGLETKLNTISNAQGQTSFNTITFGLGTSKYARLVTKAILETRLEGLGEQKLTAVFPKLVFLHRNEINGLPTSPNYDLKLLAIDCTIARVYPDFLSLDNGYLKEMYDKYGEAISPMGCRAYLSPFYKDGKAIFHGRGNLGAVTINLPKLALESNGDTNKFYKLLDKYFDMITDIHNYTYEQTGKKRGSSNPLMFCEGGGWRTVGYDDEIKPILEAYTMSYGYIGLEETSQALCKKSLRHNVGFGVEVLNHLSDKIEEAKEKHKKLFALYATPAESLIRRFQLLNRECYGVIENVTDREYMTNSHHIPVWEEIGIFEKQVLESPMFNIAKGGRIMYNEFPTTCNKSAFLQAINHAMALGLYYGANTQNDKCLDCGEQSDFKGEENCPICASSNITSINRCCGYLAYEKIKGHTRYNASKLAEIKDRVDHIK